MKTKIGLTTGALAALCYLVALFGGYIPLVLIAGYVLLAESDEWLRRMAAKALVFTLAFSTISFIISIVPGIFGVINSFLGILDVYFYPEFISDIIDLLSSVVNFTKNVTLLLLGIKAISNTTIYVPVVDDVVNRVF